MHNYTAPLSAASLILALVAPALAETRHADAHVHGTGKLNIAIEGEELIMQLDAPAHDVFGFEHAPESAAEHEAIEAAELALRDPITLFGIPGGGECEVETLSINHFGEIHELDLHEEDHAHDDDDHDHEDHDEKTHSDVEVTWHLHCHKPALITGLAMTYFNAFPRAKELEVIVLTDEGQTALEITPTSGKVRF